MGVTPIVLDGQNTGLRLDGQTSVDVIHLDLSSAQVTSDYLSAIDCRLLSEFAGRLFRLVPDVSRSSSAIGLLTRLCAVSPADGSILTLSAVVVASVATLRAEVDAAPASLVVTIPHSASGGVMPGIAVTNSGEGPSPPPIVVGDTVLLRASEPVAPGDAVSWDFETGLVWKAAPSDPARMPAIGVVLGPTPDGRYRVQVSGVVAGLYSMGSTTTLFVGNGGRLTSDLTGIPRLQVMGFWVTTTSFVLHIDPRVLVRSQ